MKSRTLFLLFCLPTYTFASCNHDVVDKDPRLACVTIVNKYDRTLGVTGYPGFNLKSGLSEETMLLPGMGNLVQIAPNPYSPYEEEKQLSCEFNVKKAKEKQILITYYKDFYEIVPIEFKNNCTFKVVWE
ncbi:hypothetical protein [Legionella sp.]|uniref:hypothetical protein n=1 Tax=Legionella sp. TaxID=459 RepID=UPI000CB95509|nr:hypothetical protein [Legionella sp.]PJE14656.1 MAG: hypothetical protein CK430_04835 [Legionella sp.]